MTNPSTIEIPVDLAIAIKAEIERTEESLDGEFGAGRRIEQIIAEDDMPECYDALVAILNKTNPPRY